VTYLADTSLVVRFRKGVEVESGWHDVIRAGLVGTCPAVEAEIIRSAISRNDRDNLRTALRSTFTWHPMPDSAWRFVERTQDALVDIGHHRGPSIVDLLVAATAQAWDLTVLHVDRDFDAIASVSGVMARRVGNR
jgi:predicted nucleic acid-binding protein